MTFTTRTDEPDLEPPPEVDPLWYERAAGRAIRELATLRLRDGTPRVDDLMLYRLVRAYEAARP
jgi:hypothetical protein